MAALNPHAGDGELFGDEENRLLVPAVARARAEGIDVTGPWPSDTLFVRAAHGEFDGIVAMYHDQGHIPLKLLGEMRAVNICAGLPIVRTSVAHGTAYDIAGRGLGRSAVVDRSNADRGEIGEPSRVSERSESRATACIAVAHSRNRLAYCFQDHIDNFVWRELRVIQR